MQRVYVPHSAPLTFDLGEFGKLLNKLCGDVPEFPPIPNYVKKEAEQILKTVLRYYVTRGRRREAWIVAAVGYARGNLDVKDLQDLLERVKYFTGKEIPEGQVKNTLEELITFLNNFPSFRSNRKYIFKYKPEEKRYLKMIRAKRR